MERDEEVCVWVLSESQGWVKTSELQYTDEQVTLCKPRPNDALLEREYRSAGAKPCENHSRDLWSCGDINKLNKAFQKYGYDPVDPYI